MEVRGADDGTELLQHEEDRAVLDEPAPVAPPDEILLLVGQSGRSKFGFRILQESCSGIGGDCSAVDCDGLSCPMPVWPLAFSSCAGADCGGPAAFCDFNCPP